MYLRPIHCVTMSDWSFQRDSHELIVLSLLSDGAKYGYAITKLAAARSEGRVRLTPGVLYPLLKSLESQGLVSASWEAVKADAEDDSTEGRKRKWYTLTAKGRRRLAQRVDALHAFRAVIDAFVAPRTDRKPSGGEAS